VACRVEHALVALLEALMYAEDLNCSAWDFALDISSIRRLNLSKSDLRWLVGKGFVDHAIEVTLPGDSDRSFRRPSRLSFRKSACFVLTAAGADVARSLHSAHKPATALGLTTGRLRPLMIAPSPERLVPTWDNQRQELRVGSVVVKRFKVPATNQEIVLAAFEEEHWPARIDDPLPPRQEQSSKRRLQETIKSLNRSQKRPLIHFLGDGSAKGICWEFCDDSGHSTAHNQVSAV
jgi:hypothetical protein